MTVIDRRPLSEIDPDAPTGRAVGCALWALAFAALLAGVVFAPDTLAAVCFMLAAFMLAGLIAGLIVGGDR